MPLPRAEAFEGGYLCTETWLKTVWRRSVAQTDGRKGFTPQFTFEDIIHWGKEGHSLTAS